jgi:hypothetical protein
MIKIDGSNSSRNPQLNKLRPAVLEYGTNTHVKNGLRLLPAHRPIVLQYSFGNLCLSN